MKLSIIRHAQAVDCDGERCLTEKGTQQSTSLGHYLRRTEQLPELVLTSPVFRARQTAELLCQAAAISAPLVEPFLRCGMRPEAALSELKAYTTFNHIALVGHEPDLSCLLMRLIGEQKLPFKVKPASLCLLEGSSLHGGWKLLEQKYF